jgi:hypothetical protein
MPLDALAQDNRTAFIQTGNTASRLPQIDAQNCDLHQNAPSFSAISTTIAAALAGRQFIPLGHTTGELSQTSHLRQTDAFLCSQSEGKSKTVGKESDFCFAYVNLADR